MERNGTYSDAGASEPDRGDTPLTPVHDGVVSQPTPSGAGADTPAIPVAVLLAQRELMDRRSRMSPEYNMGAIGAMMPNVKFSSLATSDDGGSTVNPSTGLATAAEGNHVGETPRLAPSEVDSVSETVSALPVQGEKATVLNTPIPESQPEPTSNEIPNFDSNDLASIIDSQRRRFKLTPYRPKHSDYQPRQDAVDECVAIAEAECITPVEVATRSLLNFYSSKDAWLNNNGYPLGSWAKDVGRWFAPPIIVKPEKSKPRPLYGPDSEGTGDLKALYDARTRESEERQRETDRKLAEEGSLDLSSISDIVREVKEKAKKVKT